MLRCRVCPGIETRRALLEGHEPEWITKSPRAQYWRQLFLSIPDWADRREIQAIYNRAQRWGRVVDHIVPLTHAHVCGLTVPWSLRAISRHENAARSNRWWEYTEDFWTEPEQLRLL